MRLAISTRYALRSLARHPRRTILSVVGIGLGCAVCLFMIGFVRGEGEMLMRAAAESGAGHLRIVPAGWAEKREKALRLPAWRKTLEKLRADARIEVATPRARIDALLAFGSRLVGVEAVGVDAATERAANRLVRNVVEGTYLEPGSAGTTVIGRAVATRLDIELDDEIMITVAGRDGEMKSAMLRVAGIVETGSRDLDAGVCHVPLADLEALSGYAGAGEITGLVCEPRNLAPLAESLAAALPPGSALMTWDALMPELAASVEVDETWSALTTGIIMIVVFLGIASAQLAAVMERRR